MDMAEAQRLLQRELDHLRTLPYGELLGLSQARQERAPSGVVYNIEIEAFFDDPHRKQDLRVMVSIDDGGLRSFRPLTGDFVIAPDGSFVGE